MKPPPPGEALVPGTPGAEGAPPRRGPGFRRLLLGAHRYTGLFLVTFLVVAGLTGAALAFYHELDAALNPRLFKTNHPEGVETIDPFVLREKLEASLGGTPVHWIPLSIKAGKTIAIWVEPASPEEDDEFFLDPVSGEILGSRRWGDLGQGISLNLMPFLYRLHYSLALGETGSLLFGIAALLWTIDCFVGAWLTFPAGKGNRPHGEESQGFRGWIRRWTVSWLVKGGSLFRSIFTFHRASGLWLWALLFVFAWSAVGFNLNGVFNPVMNRLLGMTVPADALAGRKPPEETPTLGWRDAYRAARSAMENESLTRGFAIVGEGFLQYLPGQGAYRYAVHGSDDLGDRWPGTRVWIDGSDGRVLAFDAHTGISAGNTLASWLFALHMGTVGGTAYRLVVAVTGLTVAVLSVTGVWIWWRKRMVKKAAGRSRGRTSGQTAQTGFEPSPSRNRSAIPRTD